MLPLMTGTDKHAMPATSQPKVGNCASGTYTPVLTLALAFCPVHLELLWWLEDRKVHQVDWCGVGRRQEGHAVQPLSAVQVAGDLQQEDTAAHQRAVNACDNMNTLSFLRNVA